MPAGNYKKNELTKIFLQSLKKSDPELAPGPDPDSLFRGTDPGIRIRTKMSWIPYTGFRTILLTKLLPYLGAGDLTRGGPGLAISCSGRGALPPRPQTRGGRRNGRVQDHHAQQEASQTKPTLFCDSVISVFCLCSDGSGTSDSNFYFLVQVRICIFLNCPFSQL